MPATNVKTRWVGGDLYFYDKAGNEISHVDGTNRKLLFASGAALDLSAATGILSLAAGEIALVDILAATLDGTIAKVVANANVIGGLLVVHQINIADAASGDTDVTLTHKTRVLDAWVVKTGGNGAATNTYTVKNGATAITDAIDGNVTDTTVKRAGTIDDAQHELAAAGTLRVSHVKGGGNSAATVYVLGMRVA